MSIDMDCHYRAIAAKDKGGRILGVLAFNFWIGKAVHIHAAIEDSLCAAGLFKAAVRYCFGELGLKAVLGQVDDGDESHRFALGVGFREVGRSRASGRTGQDLVFLELRPEYCAYYKKVSVSEFRRTA
jgi:RimJ/RimL family protein N-acetyltransferase